MQRECDEKSRLDAHLALAGVAKLGAVLHGRELDLRDKERGETYRQKKATGTKKWQQIKRAITGEINAHGSRSGNRTAKKLSRATLGAGAAIARGCTVWIVAAVWLWRAAARGAGERARWGGACGVSPPIDMAIVLSEMASATETGKKSAAKYSAKGNWAALRWMRGAGARGCRHQ